MTRLRPVMMTALAMIIGMLPMSLGLGEGGEQNAPLGRAVIGGLLLATLTTLFFVPVMYSLLRQEGAAPSIRSSRSHSRHERAARPNDDLGFALPPPAKLLARTRAIGARRDRASRSSAARSSWACSRGTTRARGARGRRDRSTRDAAARRGRHAQGRSRATARLALPGSMQPLEETSSIRARAATCSKWHVDIGDKVKEGQLLAEIDTPELDRAARAGARAARAGRGRLMQAKASARVRRSRARALRSSSLAQGLASPAGLEQRRRRRRSATRTSRSPTRRRRRAARERRGGSCSSRRSRRSSRRSPGRSRRATIERGALVTAGQRDHAAVQARRDRHRCACFVDVPQDVAPSVKLDCPAKVTVREFPARPFDGQGRAHRPARSIRRRAR